MHSHHYRCSDNKPTKLRTSKKEMRKIIEDLRKEVKEKEHTFHDQSKEIQNAQNRAKYAEKKLEARVQKTREMSPEDFKYFLQEWTVDFLRQKKYEGIKFLLLKAKIHILPEMHHPYSPIDEFKMEFVLKED